MREFPRSWFALTLVAACTPPVDAVPPLERILTLDENVDFVTGDVSPDGRYLSEIDWDTGDLQLIDLRTGEAVGLTGQGYGEGGYAWMSAFSPDGERIAVAWYLNAADRHELRVMNRDGTAPRTLVPIRDSVRYVDPLDWTPDGGTILVGLGGEDRVWRLALVDAADGSIRVLKRFSWLAPGGEQAYPNAYVSPDGRHVAYDYRPDVEAYPRNIYILAVDDGTETMLTSGSATDRVLGWLPDGDGLLFYSDRGGESAVWRLPVRAGRADGEPERIRSTPPGLAPVGWTTDGYIFGKAAETTQIHVGALDPRGGRVVVRPEPVSDPADRTSLATDWSPDGTRLAYNALDPLPGGTETLVIRDSAGAVHREVRLPAALHASTGTLAWVAEDVVVMFGSVRGRFGIQRLAPLDGSFTTLPVSGEGLDGGTLKWVEVGPGGRTLYLFPARADRRGRPLLAIDAATGAQELIGRYHADFRTLAVSPDGGRVALITRDPADGSTRLRVIPAVPDAGPGRVVATASECPGLTTPVAWTPDGRRLVYSVRSRAGRTLWSVAADGRDAPVPIGGEDWCCGGHDLRFHPDGRRIAVPGGTPRAEIWRLGLPGG